MLKSTLTAAALLVGLATAASAELYAVYPENCAIGAGGEGNVEIGNGYFAISESMFERTSERVDAGNGFFAAAYAQISEGEAIGEMEMRMRIANGVVDIIFPSGDTVRAQRCS